jgi:hypothetical protein
MTLIDFSLSTTAEKASKNGWSLAKDTQRSEFEFDWCIGLHEFKRLKRRFATGRIGKEELGDQLVKQYRLVKYALGGRFRETALMKSVKDEAEHLEIDLSKISSETRASVSSSILELLPDGDIINGKYQVNIGEGVYRVFEEVSRDSGFITLRANPFPPRPDLNQVNLRVFVPGPKREEIYRKELYIEQRLDATRKHDSPTLVVAHDSQLFVIVNNVLPDDTFTLYKYLRHIRDNPEMESRDVILKHFTDEYYKLSRDFNTRTGYLHGDISPKNVLVDGRTESLSLINFEHAWKPVEEPGSKQHERWLKFEHWNAESAFHKAIMGTALEMLDRLAAHFGVSV